MRLMRTIIILIIVAVISTVVLGSVYGFFLGQSIYQNTYYTKAGVDFWATWTLRNNIFTASVLLTILSMITLPQRSTLLTLISTIATDGKPVSKLTLGQAVGWRIIQAVALFLIYVSIGGYSFTGQNVAFLMMLVGDGSISINADQLGLLFSLPFYPQTSASTIVGLIPALEAYQLYLGLISTFVFFTAGRFVLGLISNLLSQRRDSYLAISLGSFAIGFGILLEILGVPMWTVNAGTYLSYLALLVGLAASLIAGFMFAVARLRSGGSTQRTKSKITQLEQDLARLQGELLSVRKEYEEGTMDFATFERRVKLLQEDQYYIKEELRRLKIARFVPIMGSDRSYGCVALFLIVIVAVLPIAQVVLYEIPMDGDQYLEWKFNYETKKEITLTNWAAGLEDMQIKTLEDLTSNATPESEVESLTTVRQWDQTASYKRMKNQIGTNWMQLSDSDIVYLGGHEYWVAPLTFDTGRTKTNFINQHLYYTHTEGMVVLDAYSGDLIENENLIALLNSSADINIYYGEGDGFSDVAFVNVPGFTEVGNTTFSASPDYVLSGFESLFYMFTMGPEAWSFMGRDMNMLVERDVLSRVRSILLQGLTADSDPYIVVDDSGRLHYAVSVYIDYKLATGYAHENYMRFIGQVLVDIDTGDLSFYRSPTETDEFFIDKTYMEYYLWQDAPSWLQSQMKWPEDMYETQLEVAYIYHVIDGLVWRGGLDFHQTPDGSDTRYIIMQIGGEERFVAMHNTEFRDSMGRNLAGLYIMGCGNKDFGELVFYSAGELGFSTLLGPNAAVQAFETADEVRTQLQLWGEHRYGNRLLYHLGGALFFVIPVFLEVETSSDIVIEKLGGVGLVDALTGERVELGENIVEAYYKMFGLLNQTVIEEGSVGIESAVFNPVTIESGEFADLVTLLRNNDNVTHNLTMDIVVSSGNFSVNWHGGAVTPSVYSTNTTYSLNIGLVGPGDSYGTAPQITAYLPSGLVFAQYVVQVILRTEEGISDEITLFLTVT
ncbi:MAG: conserved membrane protein of unknown function [Candidatus Thorarchaeota archaeon]|nr:MAG: conserved membrane protein of unknown function [Candidatus Thorarchaeota archaeon]